MKRSWVCGLIPRPYLGGNGEMKEGGGAVGFDPFNACKHSRQNLIATLAMPIGVS
ncbi:MAG: hypothetical protein L6Q60_04505 [Rhodocyclaceae bacterium]|nr:hypothetical protein [Rhodocyclaceae bacterium]